MLALNKKYSNVGDVLLEEFLIPLNLKESDLASMLNVHRNTISSIVNNRSRLSTEMAAKLAKALNTSVDFWLNLQMIADIRVLESDKKFQAKLAKVKILNSLSC